MDTEQKIKWYRLILKTLEGTLKFEWQGKGRNRRKVYRYNLKQRRESEQRIEYVKGKIKEMQNEFAQNKKNK